MPPAASGHGRVGEGATSRPAEPSPDTRTPITFRTPEAMPKTPSNLYDLHHSIGRIEATLASAHKYLNAMMVMIPTDDGRNQIHSELCSPIKDALAHCARIERRLSWMIEPEVAPRYDDFHQMVPEAIGPVYHYLPDPGRGLHGGNLRFFRHPIDPDGQLVANVRDYGPEGHADEPEDVYLVLDTGIPADCPDDDLDTHANAFIRRRLGIPGVLPTAPQDLS